MQYEIAKDPKSLRETLCTAQSTIANALHIMPNEKQRHMTTLQILIDECDRHRPLGINGKHANLHTDTCGCLDKGPRSSWAKIERI